MVAPLVIGAVAGLVSAAAPLIGGAAAAADKKLFGGKISGWISDASQTIGGGLAEAGPENKSKGIASFLNVIGKWIAAMFGRSGLSDGLQNLGQTMMGVAPEDRTYGPNNVKGPRVGAPGTESTAEVAPAAGTPATKVSSVVLPSATQDVLKLQNAFGTASEQPVQVARSEMNMDFGNATGQSPYPAKGPALAGLGPTPSLNGMGMDNKL